MLEKMLFALVIVISYTVVQSILLCREGTIMRFLSLQKLWDTP